MRCDHAHCGREEYEGALVTIQIGDTEQQWCRDCIEISAGLEYGDYGRAESTASHYVTAQTVAAFLLGALLMLVVASVMVV